MGRLPSGFFSFLDLVKAHQRAVDRRFPRPNGRIPAVEFDETGMPRRLYPAYLGHDPVRPVIAIDPRIAFGRPIIVRAGISTAAIAGRIDAKESAAEVAADYDLTVEEVDAPASASTARTASARIRSPSCWCSGAARR
jgi:uncharacterized protein (DUF433 family)